MKKVLFSLFMVAAMLPFVSKAQSNVQYNQVLVTDTAVCGSYEWIDGVTYTADASVSYAVADTLYFLNLTIWPEYNQEMTVSTNCGYRFDATHAYYTTGDHVYPGKTVLHHCDSNITLHLTILNQNYTGDSAVTGCNTYRWQGANYTRDTNFSSTIHHDGQACDSIINLTISIVAPRESESFDTISACTSTRYTKSDGSRVTVTRTTDIDDLFSFRSVQRCLDSTKHVHVIINYPDTTQVTEEDCGSIVYDEVEYTTTVYNKIIKVGRTTQNCDSNICLTLIVNPNPVVTIEGEWELSEGQSTTLYAACDQENVAYTWNYNGQSSNADSIVLNNVTTNTDVQLQARNRTTNCASTTWLTVTTYLGIEGAESANISLYPNPVVNMMNIESADAVKEVAIINTLGQVVLSTRNNGTRSTINLSSLSNGSYIVRMALENGVVVTKKIAINK